MSPTQAINLIMTELRKAEEKHPGWPEDRIRQTAIVVEEAGEALRATLNLIELREHLVRTPSEGYDATLAEHKMEAIEDEMVKEIAQTGAMAIRWLMNWVPLYGQEQSDAPHS